MATTSVTLDSSVRQPLHVSEAVCDLEHDFAVIERIDEYHELLAELVSGRKLSYRFITDVLRASDRTLQQLQEDFYAAID